MLVNSNLPSYPFSPASVYPSESPIDINPETLGQNDSSYLFVQPIGGGGGTTITDYVPKSTGGSFDALVSYTTQLVITDNKHLTTKKYVDDSISSAIGGGSIDWTQARLQVSAAGAPLSYLSATGVFTIDKRLSQYTNDLNWITTYAVTQQDVVNQQDHINITTSQITDFPAGVASEFDALFDARFATSSLANLGTRTHASLSSISGDGEYHLDLTQRANIIQAASASTNGYLSLADWSYFDAKLDALTAENGVLYNAGILSAVPGEIDHNSLLNYVAAQHIPLDDTQTTTGYVWSASKIISYIGTAVSTKATVYTIRLKTGATVADRIVPGSGYEYPVGWVLTADGNNLVITHNLATMCSMLTISSINGTTADEDILIGSVAYGSVVNKSGYNVVHIRALATVATALRIKMIF